MTARLRVGFVAQVRDHPPNSGTGKMWHQVLAQLDRLVDLRGVHIGRYRGRLRRYIPSRRQTWVHDGHQGVLGVRQPVVVELHEAAWDDAETRAHIAPAFIERHRALSEEAARAAAAIVTLSESSRHQIVQSYKVPPESVFVAPLGVDRNVFHPDVGDATELLAGAGADPGRPYVLFVSQLHPRKNLAALRTAMTRLVARGFPHQLVIIGDAPTDRPYDRAFLRAAASDLPGQPGRVVQLRDLSDTHLARLMAGAAAFCLPSFMEGFGLTALEAMACGAPVIVSDRGALPEVVGEAGVVVPPDDEAVEAALADVLSDTTRAEELARAGVERSRAYAWEATASVWMRAIGTVASAS